MEYEKEIFPQDQPTSPPPPPPPSEPIPPPTPTNDDTPDPEDVAQNKITAGLAYFVFFLPLLVCPTSAYARYHANQGLILLLYGIAGAIVAILLPVINWALVPVLFALAAIGFVNAYNGRLQPLPLIGSLHLIK